jgi:hypothetical protein
MTFLIVLAALFMALLVGAALEPEAPRLHAEPWGSPGYICRTGCHPLSDCPPDDTKVEPNRLASANLNPFMEYGIRPDIVSQRGQC